MQDRDCFILIFLGWNLKKLLYCGILHQHSQVFPNTKFRLKIKILKFGTKIALTGYFGLKFQNTNVIFEISILEFVNIQSFIQRQKTYLGTFGVQFNKNYYQVFYQHPQIFETINFHPKRKKKTWDQKSSIWVFGLEW